MAKQIKSNKISIMIMFNSEGFAKLLEEWRLLKKGRDYKIVSIIGCQSTGKSTLLNHLFNTSFAIMG
jgi:tRNA U34 5-carboxymethylaminomethyl modifying GTPase MnmE/TrmE